MPLATYNVTLSGATQVTSTRTPCQQVILTAGAHDYNWGLSNVATVPGGTVKTTTVSPVAIGTVGGTASLELSNLYLKGTDADVIQVTAITL